MEHKPDKSASSVPLPSAPSPVFAIPDAPSRIGIRMKNGVHAALEDKAARIINEAAGQHQDTARVGDVIKEVRGGIHDAQYDKFDINRIPKESTEQELERDLVMATNPDTPEDLQYYLVVNSRHAAVREKLAANAGISFQVAQILLQSKNPHVIYALAQNTSVGAPLLFHLFKKRETIDDSQFNRGRFVTSIINRIKIDHTLNEMTTALIRELPHYYDKDSVLADDYNWARALIKNPHLPATALQQLTKFRWDIHRIGDPRLHANWKGEEATG